MHRVPDAAELLSAIAELLEQDLGPALPPQLQHRARVAGNLCRILEREATLGPASDERERVLLTELLGRVAETDVLTRTLATRLRDPHDPGFGVMAWHALVEITRAELDIAKPGYSEWEGT